MTLTYRLLAVTLLLTNGFFIAPALAHVVLAEPAAVAGSSYRATFKVGHGCDGAATTAVVVTIPDGFTAIKPMPKPGWSLTTRRDKLDKTYTSHGKVVGDEVRQITWKGGPLPDEHYDEFVVMMKLPDAPGKYWFKVSQPCEKGSNEWVEIPAAGKSRRDLKSPAAELEVVPAKTLVDADHKH